MNKVLILLAVLLLAGIGLTMTLPAYDPQNNKVPVKAKYEIDQDSLKNPYAISDMLLQAFDTSDTQYGLRLGMFSQLQQAIDRANTFKLSDTPKIVKAFDERRTWYLMVLGPFADKATPNQMNLQLQEQQNIQGSLIRWPAAPVEEAAEK